MEDDSAMQMAQKTELVSYFADSIQLLVPMMTIRNVMQLRRLRTEIIAGTSQSDKESCCQHYRRSCGHSAGPNDAIELVSNAAAAQSPRTTTEE